MTAPVPAEVAALMRREGRPFAAPAGAIVFRPGDLCPGYILLEAGRIRVALATANGREATLYRVGPGELCVQTFQGLATGARYTASGIVEMDVAGRILGQEGFEALLERSEAFRRFFLVQAAERFDRLTAAVERTAFTPIPARLAAALLAHAEGDTVALTHAGLADEIGTAREVVSRQLERFARAGLVTLERNRIRILAPQRLREAADPAP